MAGSTGQLIPSTQVLLQDRFSIGIKTSKQARIVSTETGKDVQLGEAGELLVRGPQVNIHCLTSLNLKLRFKEVTLPAHKNTELYDTVSVI